MLENVNISSELKKWIESHIDLSSNIFCSTKSNFYSTRRFDQMRHDTHSRTFQDLISFKNKIYKEIESISNQISQFTINSVITIPPIIYDNSQNNLTIRKFAFVETKMKRIEMKILKTKYLILLNIGEQITILMALYKSDLIPENIICSISPKFYDIAKNIKKDPKILKLLNKLQMLKIYHQKLKTEISDYQKPLWTTEKGYTKFLLQLIKDNIDKIDSSTNYVPCQQCELSLSRCLFNNKTNKLHIFDSTLKEPKSQYSYHYSYDDTYSYILNFLQNKSKKDLLGNYQPMIDNVIDRFPYMDPKEFTQSIILLAKSLVPFDVYKSLQTTEEISLIVTFFYRIIFERVYEKFDYFFINFEVNKKLGQFLNDLKMNFTNDWPLDYMNVEFVNTKEEFKLNKPNLNLLQISRNDFDQLRVKDYFNNDGYFVSAAEFLNETMFCSNPIDALYHISKSLLSIQKGAVIHKIQKKKLRPEFIDHVLCFDDNFTLLIGTFVASEIPDLFFLNWFIQSYSPSASLSSPLEFAFVNIEGLTKYINTIYHEKIKNISK